MENEIEEYLNNKYKNIVIKVKFKEFRHYQIIINFTDIKALIDFTYDNHFVFEVNMNSLSNYIDKVILDYYRREEIL